MKKIFTLIIIVLAVFTVQAQTNVLLEAPTPNTSTQLRAPNGQSSHAFLRASTIVTSSELASMPATSITHFGFNLNNGTSIPVTGNMKIYMMNTTSNTYANGNAWSSIIGSMVLVYDGPVTLPDTSAGSLPYYQVALTTPFNYTGNSIYLAYDWSTTGPFSNIPATYPANSTIPSSLVSAASATTAPTTLTATAFRPEFRFQYVNPFVNDVTVRDIFSLSKAPLTTGVYPIRVAIRNTGSGPQTNLPVTINITGANTYTNTITLGSLAPGQDTILTFLGFMPTNRGINNITVSVPTDEVIANNQQSAYFEVTCNTLSYADTTDPISAIGFNTGSGLLLARYGVAPNMTDTVRAVNVFLGTTGIGASVYAVVLNSAGTIVGTSDTLTITASDTSSMHTFQINSRPAISGGTTGTDYYVGLAQIASTPGFYPVAYQSNTIIPENIFFTTGINGGVVPATDYTDFGIWMIEALLTAPASLLTPVPGAITGLTQICGSMTNVTYTVPAVAGATSYEWTVPAGATIVGGATSNTITVNFSGVPISDNITVAGVNECGPGLMRALNISVKTIPSVPAAIVGPSQLCGATTNVTYTVPAVAGATSYVWTVPTGATVVGTDTTNTITVNFSGTAISDSITVAGINTCGTGMMRAINISVVSLPSVPGAIAGQSQICGPETNVTYTVPAVTGATSYLWTVPAGATIVGSATSNSITVNYSGAAVSDSITVAGVNVCGPGMIRAINITVTPLTPVPGAIAGQSQICGATTNVTYTVPVVTGATSYVWTVPAGATIVGSNNTNTITVNFSGTTISDSITVAGVNVCGPGMMRAISISVNPQPDASFTFAANNNNYTFTNTSVDGTTYLWDFGTGDTSNLASPAYTFLQNGTYNVCLTAINGGCMDQSCETITVTGVGIESPLGVSFKVFPNPANDVITIDVKDNRNGFQAVLYNAVGQAVERINIENGINKLNTANLASGIYHLEIFNNEVKDKTKVIIQK